MSNKPVNVGDFKRGIAIDIETYSAQLYKDIADLEIRTLFTPRHAGKSTFYEDMVRAGQDRERRNAVKAATFGHRYGGTLTGRISSSLPTFQELPRKEPNVNPTILKQVTFEASTTQRVEIENTKWFDATTTEPGQPGVFEVNPVQQFDDGSAVVRRFSYFNGKSFGPIASSPDYAYRERFGKTHLIVAQFRGLKEAA